MNQDERKKLEKRLHQIPQLEWNAFLSSAQGRSLSTRLRAVREGLRAADLLGPGAPKKPVDELVNLLGDRILADGTAGPWIREQLLRTASHKKWTRLVEAYRELPGVSKKTFHGNMKQTGGGAALLARRWRRGGRWEQTLCEILDLPECLARGHGAKHALDEELIPVEPLPPLHDFQLEVYKRLRRLLGNGRGSSAMLSLPTGAGKTRVAVEAVCDHLASAREGARRDIVIWIAHSEELLLQAWEAFRQVWQVPPKGNLIPRAVPLRLVRMWDSPAVDLLEPPHGPTVYIAGVQQLQSWVKREHEALEHLPASRVAAVVIDEAHRVICKQYRDVLVRLGLRAVKQWQPLGSSPPVIGLSATPWRGQERQEGPLVRYFQKLLIKPGSLGGKPIKTLQKRGILAKVDADSLTLEDSKRMTAAQWRKFEQFQDLPADFLEQLGMDAGRNARILKRLAKLPKKRRVLVFACSVVHAETLALLVNSALGSGTAAVVTAATPRLERAEAISRFRDGGLRMLVNVSVLTTGFDAPKADVVCMTRPTASALLYEQMVGRGLRGPKNGGTAHCTVLDVQDVGLPDSIQSYGRVARLWDS